MSTSYPLYPRSCAVQVGGTIIPADPATGLHVHFRIKRGVHVSKTSIKPRANTCELKLWGLRGTTRNTVSQAAAAAKGAGVPVIIMAGYQGHTSKVFDGQLRPSNTFHDGAEVILTMTAGDGDTALQQRMNVSLGQGTTARAAMQKIVAALGIGPGNLNKALTLIDQSAIAGQLFARGAYLRGSAADIMTDVCRALGLQWSIQDGALSLTQANQALAGQAILIDQDHGMQGSPSVDTRGLLNVKLAMIPGIVPGVQLSVQSLEVQGFFNVLSVETVGDNFGNEWLHHVEAQRPAA